MPMDTPLMRRVRELLLPMLASRDLEVFDIEWGGTVLRVVLDRAEGTVGIDDCAAVSEFLSAALDAEDLIPGRYRLEVSSPGLDRPLRSPEEFGRFEGRLCRVHLVEAEDGNHVLVGRIVGAGPEGVRLRDGDGAERAIAYGNVKGARLEVEF